MDSSTEDRGPYKDSNGGEDEKLPRLYDDDESFYASNAELEPDDTDADKQAKMAELKLAEASTFDLLRELDKRFSDFIFMGKRRITTTVTGKDREVNRQKSGRVDNRKMAKGDLHTLLGLNMDLDNQLKYALEMGLEYIRFGYGTKEDDEFMGVDDSDDDDFNSFTNDDDGED